MTPASRRAFLAAAPMIALAFLIGCGPSTTTVKGKVTSKGKSLVWGNVTLIDSTGMSYTGDIKEDGTFVIEKVTTGSAKIGVSSPKPAAPEPEAKAGKMAGEGSLGGRAVKKATENQFKNWFAINDKYSDPNSSGLSETISSKELVIDLP